MSVTYIKLNEFEFEVNDITYKNGCIIIQQFNYKDITRKNLFLLFNEVFNPRFTDSNIKLTICGFSEVLKLQQFVCSSERGEIALNLEHYENIDKCELKILLSEREWIDIKKHLSDAF